MSDTSIICRKSYPVLWVEYPIAEHLLRAEAKVDILSN